MITRFTPLLFLLALAACNTASQKQAQHSREAAPGRHGSDAPAAASGPVKPAETVAATAIAPEFIQLARNVEVIPNIENAVKSQAAVLTDEGQFGPLLFAEQTRAFFIVLKPGMFLAEHPHEIGSIVYTVRGAWVLASEGKRRVMEAGSLFRFGDGMPTGWEAPFGEDALLLIVKPKGDSVSYEAFNKGIMEMKQSTADERAKGTPFYYNELEPDHPALKFAREVNPKFDDVLKIRY